MIIIFVQFIDQLIDYPINCASLSKYGTMHFNFRIMYFATEQKIWSRPVDDMRYANSKTGVTATNLNISGKWDDSISQPMKTSPLSGKI